MYSLQGHRYASQLTSLCKIRMPNTMCHSFAVQGHRYTSQLTSLCETAVERAAALHAAAAQARQAPTADQDTQVPPSSEDPDSKKKGGEKKGGGKKGKDKKGGGGGGAKEAERLAALAAELRAAKEQKLMEAARVCLGDVLVYARSTPMTALQVSTLHTQVTAIVTLDCRLRRLSPMCAVKDKHACFMCAPCV